MGNKSCGKMLYVMAGITVTCILCVFYKILSTQNDEKPLNIETDNAAIVNEQEINVVDEIAQEVAGSIINLPSGFYESGTKLVFTVQDGTTVYYTMDGSMPSIGQDNTFCLEEGCSFELKDASDNPNIYSNRTDSSLAYEETMHYAGLEKAVFAAPDGLVDKCNVVHAIAVDIEGNIVSEQTEVYFIGYEEKQGYELLKTVALVIEPDDFWGYEKGINILGKTFDEADKDSLQSTWGKAYSFYSANYGNTGAEWERETQIFIFDENHELIEDKRVGIRVKGNGSRGVAQKSFNVFARKKYDANDVFTSSLFDSGMECESISLFNGGAFSQDKLKDLLTSEFAGNLKFGTLEYKPCALFINGEYWGMYYLAERIDDRYIENHYNVDKNNIVIIKNRSVQEGLPEDLNLYLDMVNYVSNNDMSLEEKWEEACRLIDMDSFIDYYAYEMYIYNADWPGNNTALWRAKKTSEDEYCDGRWRYILFDADASFGNASIEDTLELVLERDTVFSSLYNNEQFREKFFTRLQDIGNICFDNKKTQQYIDEYQILRKDSVKKSVDRWYYDKKYEKIFYDIGRISNFLGERCSDVNNFLADFYKIDDTATQQNSVDQAKTEHQGELIHVYVDFTGQDKGTSILLNGLEIKESETVWSGEYLYGTELFFDIPINGNTNFAGWKLEGYEEIISETSYHFTLEEGAYIEAVFK